MGPLGWWGRFVYRRKWLVLVVSLLMLGVSVASLLAGGQLRNVQFRDTEAGRGVESVMIDGRMVVSDRVVTTIDEAALRREVASLMRHFLADYDAVVKSRKVALPHMLEAHRRTWKSDVGMDRFIARAR